MISGIIKNRSVELGEKVLGKAVNKVVSNINPLEALTECLKYKNLEDIEITRREEIRAKRDVALAAIQSQRDLMESYFEHRFIERKESLTIFFNLLSDAVKEKNETFLNDALTGILGIVKDSPLKDFESFRQARVEGKTIEI